jgi:uncharacterized protein YbjT (DUF2867 family)
MLVDTAKVAGVKLFVWSSLESFTEITNGRFALAQFCDSKASIEAYARASGVPLAVAKPGFWSGNIAIAYYALKRQADGSYLFTLPIAGETRVSLSGTAHDFGLCMQAQIESPELGVGSEVRGGTMISLNEIVAELARGTSISGLSAQCMHNSRRWIIVSGKEIVYRQVERESWLTGFPPTTMGKLMGPILGDMFQTFEAAGCA